MRNLIRRKILPAALAVLMLAATPALAFAANTDGEIVPTTYEIVKTASSDTVVPGGEISYTIKVLIHGDPEEGISVPLAVQDALPEGLEYVEGSLSWKGEDEGCTADTAYRFLHCLFRGCPSRWMLRLLRL